MDLQFQNAVEISVDPRSDQNLKAQAFEFLTQLRNDPAAWPVCLELLVRSPKASDSVRLVAADYVAKSLQNEFLVGESLQFAKDKLMEYVRRTYGGSASSNEVDQPALQNKLAQTLTILFASLYKQTWGSFFDDFRALVRLPNSSSPDNLVGATFYLRVLQSVHDEIADVLVARENSEQRLHTELKDHLRTHDMAQVANSWNELLSYWCDKSDSVVGLCLRVLGRWVSWIDISLVVNQETVNVLLRLAGRTSPSNDEDVIRDSAITCFNEIVSKKMPTADKINMIILLDVGNIVSQLIASPGLSDFRYTSKYDPDFAEVVARLVNTTVYDLVKALEDEKAEDSVREHAQQLLQVFVPFLLRFLSDEYDEICSTIIPSVTDILTLFRKKKPLPPLFGAVLPSILNEIILKMRFDKDQNWGAEDEQTEEADFHDLRKRLQVLQRMVAAVDETLYIQILSNLVERTFENFNQHGSQIEWRGLELALHEMYLFGELALPNQGLYTKNEPSSIAAERLVVMMTQMMSSGVSNFAHPAIMLQYMETVVRYWTFFEVQTNLIPQVLEEFVRFAHEDNLKVRSRSWYLFSRLVKHLRKYFGDVSRTVIESLGDILPINAEVQNDQSTPDEDASSDESEIAVDGVFLSQLYLYEAIGLLSSVSTIPLDQQVLLVRFTINPLFADMERNLPGATSGDARSILQIHHIIVALATYAHGFHEWKPNSVPAPTEIATEFEKVAEVILIALNALNSSADVRASARTALSRFLGVLGSKILLQLPRWIDGLLSQSASKDEMVQFLRLLNHLIL